MRLWLQWSKEIQISTNPLEMDIFASKKQLDGQSDASVEGDLYSHAMIILEGARPFCILPLNSHCVRAHATHTVMTDYDIF